MGFNYASKCVDLFCRIYIQDEKQPSRKESIFMNATLERVILLCFRKLAVETTMMVTSLLISKPTYIHTILHAYCSETHIQPYLLNEGRERH